MIAISQMPATPRGLSESGWMAGETHHISIKKKKNPPNVDLSDGYRAATESAEMCVE